MTSDTPSATGVVDGSGGAITVEGGGVQPATPEQEAEVERVRRKLANYCGRCGALFTPDEHGDVRCGNGHGRAS